MVWGLTLEVRGALGGGGEGGKWDNCNSINNKTLNRKKIKINGGEITVQLKIVGVSQKGKVLG